MNRQYPLPLPHDEAMSADDFMIAASNREAAGWLDKWPEWPSHCLVIHGPSGSGKTHLTRMWLARSRGKQVTPDELTAQDAGSLIVSNRHIAIDDAGKIAGDAAGEEALFHLYNLLREMKGFLLLTAPQAPAHWRIGLADLRSRLAAAPAVAIAAPDDELLSALIIKQFRDRQIDIGTDVIAYILPRITRTPAAIRTLVTSLDRASLAEGRGITVALARRVLEDQP